MTESFQSQLAGKSFIYCFSLNEEFQYARHVFMKKLLFFYFSLEELHYFKCIYF